MTEQLARFLRTRRIDSYQKLRLLLLLYRHTGKALSKQEITQRLHLGDIHILQSAINELQAEGMIRYNPNSGCVLQQNPELESALENLAQAFEDPLARQKILAQVNDQASLKRFIGDRPGFILAATETRS